MDDLTRERFGKTVPQYHATFKHEYVERVFSPPNPDEDAVAPHEMGRPNLRAVS